jgi:hypothetical protein
MKKLYILPLFFLSSLVASDGNVIKKSTSKSSKSRAVTQEYRNAKLALLERQCAGLEKLHKEQERANTINKLQLAVAIATADPAALQAKCLSYDNVGVQEIDVIDLCNRARNFVRFMGLPLFHNSEPRTAERANERRTSSLEMISK